MAELKRLAVTVHKVSGHGVHALFPHEKAVCEAWLDTVGGPADHAATGPAKMNKGPHWDERLELYYKGGTPRAVHVRVFGVLPSGIQDMVGDGVINLPEVLERGSKVVLAVPLMKNGKKLGQLEVVLEHTARLPEA